MNMIDITKEPTGDLYGRLLVYLAKTAHCFSLVRCDQSEFNASADKVESELRPFQVKQAKTDKWPGTELIGHLATVTFYRVSPETIAILTKVAGLYRWLSPHYPEDLAFYRADETCLLASVSHEKDAWFEGDLEIDDIKVGVPGLKVAKHDRDCPQPAGG